MKLTTFLIWVFIAIVLMVICVYQFCEGNFGIALWCFLSAAGILVGCAVSGQGR